MFVLESFQCFLTTFCHIQLGCGHGLPGIFSCLQVSNPVYLLVFTEDLLNWKMNLFFQEASAVHFQDFNSEVLECLTIPNVVANLPVKSQSMDTDVEVRFFAGDWSEVHQILPNLQTDDQDSNCCSGPSSSAGYDIILMAETVYSISTLPALYELIKKVPHGFIHRWQKLLFGRVG